ncbi:UDP-glucose/GDP-mannose dehydrogenase family protein [bacterium]|nr:UDP-glucose/GDP-mannose dehydrogenase family protein [bacterium]MBT4551640.1 UDP-glucose/GDP-mannose dehydrogenase family protein [bacterium]
MKIAVIGTGYVGLVTGVCLAEFGHQITCMDIHEEKIVNLKKGILPIYEPGLEEVLARNYKEKRIDFTTDIKKVIKEHEVLFIAVGTPPKEDGGADLKHVLEVAAQIGQNINEYKVIVNKSTVPVGTGKKVENIIFEEINKQNKKINFDVVSNPEFLREGKAVEDFMHPDRVVIGSKKEKVVEILKEVYRVLYLNQTPFVFTNLETAEMIKYASNAFLAVKISFINEVALLCEKVGANVQDVAKAMGMDGRISSKFLHAGPGYGGSCFPKDTKALVHIGEIAEEELFVVKAAIEANEKQKIKMVKKIEKEVKEVKNKTFAILGLSFKPETDDMRDAPALTIIEELIKLGANIKAYCPQGIKEAKWRLKLYKDNIVYCDNEYECAKDTDGIILITEWNQFRGMDLKKIKNNMKDNYFFDLRNVYFQNLNIRKLFKYFGVGVL